MKTEERDRWAIWFSRVVQLVGLAIVVYEVLLDKQRPYLLLVAAAMMLGARGLRLIVRGLLHFEEDET